VPKGTPNTHRWDCSQDHLVVAALGQGFGRELVLSGLESFERADAVRKGIYRCARHRRVSAEAGPARVVDQPAMGIRKTGRTYALHFKMHRKRDGRRHLLDHHGPDRASWPYDPRRPATGAERESWAPRNERGQAVSHDLWN